MKRSDFMAGYSARYILEDLNNEQGMLEMHRLTGLPVGVIVSAFENIFSAANDEEEEQVKTNVEL